MRTVTTIVRINRKANVEISNYGTTTQSEFAQILFFGGRIDFELRRKMEKQNFTSEFLTSLLNQNIDLFPEQF